MWQRRAMIVPEPPTFLESLLYSTGVGMERGMDRYYKERDRKRSMANQVISQILSGDVSPQLLATDLGQSFQRQLGIDKEPAIKEATQMGLEEASYQERTEHLPGGAAVTMPGVTPKEIPFELHRKKQEEAKEIEAQAEQRRELKEYRLKKEIDQDVKIMSRLSPEKRLERLSEYMRAFERIGVDPKTATFTDPEAGITMTLPMKYQIEKDKEAERIKSLEGGEEFLKVEKQWYALESSKIKMLTSIATGESMVDAAMREAFADGTVGKGYEKIVSKISKSSPKTQVYALLDPINKERRSLYQRMKLMVKRLNLPDYYVPEFKRITMQQIFRPETREEVANKIHSPLSDGIDVEKKKESEPTEVLSRTDTRNVTTPPKLPEGPTEDEYKELVRDMRLRGWNKKLLEGESGELMLGEAKKQGFDSEKIRKYFQ